MRKLVSYMFTSIDGFIATPTEDWSGSRSTTSSCG
jgi:hypothetical protein